MKRTAKHIIALLLCAAMLMGVSAAAFADGSALSSAGAPEITEQPDPYGWGAAYGELVSLSVSAEGDALRYQWYYQTPGSETWTKVRAASGRTDTYEFRAYTRHDGYKYKCVVSNEFGSAESEIVSLKVHTAPAVFDVGGDSLVRIGDTACIGVTAMGKSLRYQWYYQKPDSDVWTKVRAASGRTEIYEFTVAARHHGYKYKCIVSNEFGSFDTAEDGDVIVVISVIGAPEIILDPVSAAVPEDQVCSFTVKADGEDLHYQWYYQKPGSETWTKVARGGTSATYTLSAAARHNGYKYRCKVSNSCGSVMSGISTLVVIPKPVITAQPESVSVGANYSATFTARAEGKGLSYQWYYQRPGETTWNKVKVNGTSATYVLKLAANHNDFRYKCVVTCPGGSVESDIAVLRIK